MYDLIIIGGGPAAAGGAVYAARKLLKTALIADTFGGQSTVSPEIQNWIGTEKISGADLAKNLENHVKAYAGNVVDIHKGEYVTKVEPKDGGFVVTTKKGTAYEGKTVLVATGGSRRKLEVPGAAEFDNKGLTYCASCDGPLFSDMDVVVVGGGNAGFETASQLLAYVKSVTLLHRGDKFTADPVTVNKVLEHPNMKALLNTEPTEVFGDKLVQGIKYKDKKTGEEHTLNVSGVFVEIGLVVSSDFVKGLVDMDPINRVIVDHRSQRSSMTGIWAAGDVTDGLYHQNNIAVGDAVKAVEDIYVYLHAR